MIRSTLQNSKMESICLFSCFLIDHTLPIYLKNYIKEISRHFSKTILLTHRRDLQKLDLRFLKSVDVELLHVENRGFDFGMYYQAIGNINFSNCSQLALVNDSNVLCQNLDPFFDWLRPDLDMAGLLDSYEIDYHIQSYFLVFQNSGVLLFLDYLRRKKIKKTKKKVIKTYEIGLTSFFRSKGLLVDSYFKVDDFVLEKFKNPCYFLIKTLLLNEFPLIKKKILLDSYDEGERTSLRNKGFEFEPQGFLKIIKTKNPKFNFEGLD